MTRLHARSIAPLVRTEDRTPKRDGAEPRARAPIVPVGVRRRLAHVVLAGMGLLAAFVGRYWYDGAAQQPIQLGISFSCRQVQYLGGECQAAYAALLDDLGVRHVRLSLYWSDVERRPGQYDYSEADKLVDAAAARSVDVLLTLGIKAQRFPEVYIPAWLEPASQPPEGAVLDSLPGVYDAALRFIASAVQHFEAQPAVIGWQVENEPFIKNFTEIRGWTVSAQMTAAEVAAVRAADSGHRPVVVTHSSWTIYDRRWQDALNLGDVLGQNVFTKKAWIADSWYFFPYRMGPWVPDLPGQAAAARHAGKQLWITELQAEPEERHSLTTLRPDAAHSISAGLLGANVALARRSGAGRAYLWGAEWWYASLDTPSGRAIWEEARRLFNRP